MKLADVQAATGQASKENIRAVVTEEQDAIVIRIPKTFAVSAIRESSEKKVPFVSVVPDTPKATFRVTEGEQGIEIPFRINAFNLFAAKR